MIVIIIGGILCILAGIIHSVFHYKEDIELLNSIVEDIKSKRDYGSRKD